jgi:hypothetical protein
MYELCAFDFCYKYFQTIMDLEFQDLNWDKRERVSYIRHLCDEYREAFHLDKYYYSNVKVWKIIKAKHTKYFDELLDRVLKD